MTAPLTTLHLPWPPSVNGLFAGKARRYPSLAYRKWKAAAGWELQAQRPPQISVRVDVAIGLTPPDRRARDADNHVKAVLDLLVAQRVLADDAQEHVREVRVSWAQAERPGATVTITPAS